jgi:hypothetical protein
MTLEEAMKTPTTKDAKPDRQNLGPTGPAKVERNSDLSYDDKHPNAGDDSGGVVGPTPTDVPDAAKRFQTEIDRKRAQTPPD